MTEYFRPDYTPEWFHLEDYEPLKDMTRETISHLIQRRSLYYTIGLKHRHSDNRIEEKLVRQIFDIEKTPDFSNKELRGVATFSFSDFLVIEEVNHKLGLAVLLEELRLSKNVFAELEKIRTDPSYIDDGDIMDALSWGDIAVLKKRFETEYKDIFDLSRPIPSVLLNVLTINLAHNDDKIVDDMREWLRKKRGNQAKKRYEAAITGKEGIIEQRLIPCMDLLIWEKFKGFEFKQRELAMMLFPHGEKGESNIGKTIKPNAIKYLTTDAYNDIL